MQAARGGRPVGERALPTLLATAALAVIADQTTKAVAVASLGEGETIRVLDGVLRWRLERNPGAAFGLFQNLPVLFTALAFAITIGILVAAPRVRGRLLGVGLGLVLGGAVGNLIDRLVREPGPFRGRVVDFVKLPSWPTFNVADAAVVIGALLILLDSARASRAER